MFKNIEYFGEYELASLFAEFNEESFRALPAKTSQQIIKLLFRNIKSWQNARAEWFKNPNIFLGRPRLPKYKKELSIAIFSNQQVRLKNGFIYFPESVNLAPLKTRVSNICQVRVVPNSDHFTIEVIYNKQEKEIKPYNGNWMGVDLGMNNLATCVTSKSAIIYNGRPLKSINEFYNKRKSKLQSVLPNNKFKSKRISRLISSRKNKIENNLHQISNKIIKQAENENVTRIIIGNNKNWKQEINLGRYTNRNFVSIPHGTLIEKIKYKGLLNGIEVVIIPEAYTSKCSALDLEPIGKHESYVGRRIKRGLFKTATGLKINADCNGALNIARLVSGDEIISDSVRSIVSMPMKIVLFNKSANLN